MGTNLVVAGVLLRRGRVLLCHRSPQRTWYPDVWDLPGGHIRRSESADSALVRELAEELGVNALPAFPPIARIDADDVDLTIYAVKAWSGEVINRDPREHDRLGWFTKPELHGIPLAHPAYLGLLSSVLAEDLRGGRNPG